MDDLMKIWLRALAVFVEKRAGGEAIDAVGRRNGVWLVVRDEMGEAEACTGHGLEAAITPAAVEVETVHIGPIHDRRAVHGHIDEAGPCSQYADTADQWHQGHAGFTGVLDRAEVAALGIGVVAVDIAAEHQSALVRLADIEMTGAIGDHARYDRLDRLGHA